MNEQKTITIKEALGFPEGTPIPRITGKVTHIFDRKSGEGDHGPYSCQSGVIQDGDDKILFTLWNKPEIPQDYKGRKVIFRAGNSKKPSLTLKSDFKDPTKRTLNVTKSCIMLTEDEETDDIPMEYPERAPAMVDGTRTGCAGKVETSSRPQANAEPKKGNLDDALMDFKNSKPDPKDGVKEARQFLMQCVNMRRLADTAAQVAAGELYDKPEVKDIGTSFFMAMEKAGYLSKMPKTNSLSKKEDVEASEPDMMEEDAKF